MREKLTAAEARAHFGRSLRLVERGQVVEITRHGRLVAALVAAEDLAELERLRASRPQRGLQSLIARWDDGDEFNDEVDRVLEERGSTRELPDLEP